MKDALISATRLVLDKDEIIYGLRVQRVSRIGVDFCVRQAQQSFASDRYEDSAWWVYFGSSIAWCVNPGYFYNEEMENLLKKISLRFKNFDMDDIGSVKDPCLNDSSSNKRILHVVSTVSGSGGHTRVVAKWIENCNLFFKSGQVHDVCLTQQGITDVPLWLSNVVKKSGGKIYVLPTKNGIIKKAELLSSIAKKSDIIVLSIHPNDPIANIAFGTPIVGRKVFLFNHADHVFSLGTMVSDLILDFRLSGQKITKSQRSCLKSVIVPIPLVETCDAGVDQISLKEAARNNLGLGREKKVILTVGDEYKYQNAFGYDFKRCVRGIISKDPNILVYAVGIPCKGEWKKLSKESNGAFVPVGRIKNKVVFDSYYAAADVYMEGFPFSSLTAMLEAGLNLLPIQRMHNPVAPILSGDDLALDGLISVARSESEYIEGAVSLINLTAEKKNKLGRAIRESIISKHCGSSWVESFIQPILTINLDKFDENVDFNSLDASCVKSNENEKISLSLFQVAYFGSSTMIVRAFANSSISIRRLIYSVACIVFDSRKDISCLMIFSLIGLVCKFLGVRLLPVSTLVKIRNYLLGRVGNGNKYR